LQKRTRVDERLPCLPNGGGHRRHLLPVRVRELAKPADRFRKLLPPAGDFSRPFLFGFQKSRGRALLWPFASILAAESRDITAARHLDDQRIVAPDSRIVSRQRLAHADRLDPHDRIGLRVKIGAATERFDRNGVGFQLAAVARERRFDNERKKACQAIGVAERAAVDDPTKFVADVVGVRSLRIPMSGFVISPGKSILHRPPWWLNRPGAHRAECGR